MSANLDLEKQALLIKFRERVADVLHGLKNDYQREDDNLLKFLIARDYNIDKAEEMFRKCIEWRLANNVNSILEQPFRHEFDPYYQVLLPGFDKIGHPILVVPIGRWDPMGLLQPNAKASAPTIFTQFFEKALDICDMMSKDGKLITTAFAIIDGAEFDYKVLANTAILTTGMSVLRENSQMLINCYPESVYKVVVVNAPSLYKIAWALIKPLLPRATLEKFRIYGNNNDKWKNYLLEHIDPNVLPSQYGGANTTGLFDCRLEPDKPFIPRRDLELLPPEKLQEYYIEPGKSLSVDITTKPGDVIVWNFKTETYDIGFKVGCDDGRVIIDECKVDAHKFTQKGKLNCPSGANYTFTWVNSYSYVNGKQLFYTVITRQNGKIGL